MPTMPVVGAAPGTTRPRVAGEREEEILDATVRLLVDVGYDKLTLDAVAAEARASKATLYRRWSGLLRRRTDRRRSTVSGGWSDVGHEARS